MLAKKRERITILIWLLFTCAIRVLYYLFDYTGVTDPYGFFDYAILRAEQQEYYTGSGLGFAYTHMLERFVLVFYDDISVVFVWQLLLELIALFLIVLAARNFWGIYSAISIGILLTVSPILLVFLKTCSPEEFFLNRIAILFFVLSVFYDYSRKKSWFRSTAGELLILVMGIYTGMLCIWNYLGFAAFAAMVLIVIRNYRIIKDKTQLLELTDGKEIEEKDQIMNVFVQTFMLILGTALGGFFTLLKYTGYTGYTITEQFLWWTAQFKTLPDRTMDMDTFYALYLVLTVTVGSLAGAVIHKLKKPKAEKQEQIEKKEMEQSENYDLGNKDDRPASFTTEDGREIDFIENPLPGPKPHEHRELKFDLDELSRASSDLVIFDETKDINLETLRKSIIDVEGENPGVRFVNRDIGTQNRKASSFSTPEIHSADDLSHAASESGADKQQKAAAISAALSAVSSPAAIAREKRVSMNLQRKEDEKKKREEERKRLEEEVAREVEQRRARAASSAPTPAAAIDLERNTNRLREMKDDFDIDIDVKDDFDF
ncbi:MAG: hypothetical protein K6F53_02755 [Lachnospiraceae bacterium]|nr:hypothetical protein [Lachnospiraceae bacterium]